MLHDPEMEVSCDNPDCNESLYLPMNWSTGGYDLKDSDAENLLINTHAWIVSNGGHYCCEECADVSS